MYQLLQHVTGHWEMLVDITRDFEGATILKKYLNLQDGTMMNTIFALYKQKVSVFFLNKQTVTGKV
jgi:hypothetical protein